MIKLTPKKLASFFPFEPPTCGAGYTLEELVTAVEELPPAQKAILLYRLQHSEQNSTSSFTREQAIAELEALRATGAFEQVESLLGKYKGSGDDISAAELLADIHENATEWESELDEFYGDEA